MDLQSENNNIGNEKVDTQAGKDASNGNIFSCTKTRARDCIIFSVISATCAIIVMVLYHTSRVEDNNESTDPFSNSTLNDTDHVCHYVNLIGDEVCDDEANTEACLYDLGDCCCHLEVFNFNAEYGFNLFDDSAKKIGCLHVDNLLLCEECFCYTQLNNPLKICDGYGLGLYQATLEDGTCNMVYNFPENYCCLNEESLNDLSYLYMPNKYHDICVASNMSCIAEELGDGKCQDYNNAKLCDFDLGDCCVTIYNYHNFHDSCCACFCHVTGDGAWGWNPSS